MAILISICIPSYNGEKTIAKTLNNIIDQINANENFSDLIEIIINDDNSRDNTLAVCNEFEKKYHFIKVSANPENLGMDKNFEKVTKYANGKYIWFFGQDDLIEPNGINRVIDNIINFKPNLISLNYSQVSENGEIINPSYLRYPYIGNKPFPLDETLYYEKSTDFFRDFNSAPTFLPATIMKKEYWDNFISDDFEDTAYVQVACILSNIQKGEILVDTMPVIRGLIPSNKWQKDGNKRVRIMTGKIKMLSILNKKRMNSMPQKTYKKQLFFFFLNFPFIISNAWKDGFKNDKKLEETLLFIYGKWAYLLFPVITTPNLTNNTFFKLLNASKRNMVKSFNLK